MHKVRCRLSEVTLKKEVSRSNNPKCTILPPRTSLRSTRPTDSDSSHRMTFDFVHLVVISTRSKGGRARNGWDLEAVACLLGFHPVRSKSNGVPRWMSQSQRLDDPIVPRSPPSPCFRCEWIWFRFRLVEPRSVGHHWGRWARTSRSILEINL